MEFGVSTACLFPKETAASLKMLQKQNIRTVELFLNSFCELEPSYVEKLAIQIEKCNTNVTSMHPFTSGMESFFFASHYSSRFQDGLDLYKKYFAACQMLNIPRLVFHGDYSASQYPFKKHCEKYLRLRHEARVYGVELCYENVVRCKCGLPTNIKLLREHINDDVSFVLDIKQMRRANVKLIDMLDAMSGKISLMHVSDYSDNSDCILPMQGRFDFKACFNAVKQNGFCGDVILELYKDGYKTAHQLAEAAILLETLYENKDGATR